MVLGKRPHFFMKRKSGIKMQCLGQGHWAPPWSKAWLVTMFPSVPYGRGVLGLWGNRHIAMGHSVLAFMAVHQKA